MTRRGGSAPSRAQDGPRSRQRGTSGHPDTPNGPGANAAAAPASPSAPLPRLAAGATVVVLRSCNGLELQVHNVEPKDTPTVIAWVNAVWDRVRVELPGPDTIPGSAAATHVPHPDDPDFGALPRRAGFRAPS